MIGSKISQYEIVGTLGSGGMGVFSKAKDTTLDRTVALEFLPELSSDDAPARSRFHREARAASALNHPPVCVIHELGGDDHPDAPEAVDRLAEVLDSTDGPLLIHCGYGGRAAYLWLAYLVEHKGITLDQAMARGKAMMLKTHPLSRLLNRPTTLAFAADSGAH